MLAVVTEEPATYWDISKRTTRGSRYVFKALQMLAERGLVEKVESKPEMRGYRAFNESMYKKKEA